VQTVIPLGDGSALRLTTSKYFTPLGKEIHGKGVIPDIVAEEGKIQLVSEKETAIIKPEEVFETVEQKENTAKEDKTQDYKSDNQLIRAVDVLKALKIYRSGK
jgi:carboxyl-terminal processing protease